jgi:LPS-assembly lipoprotein
MAVLKFARFRAAVAVVAMAGAVGLAGCGFQPLYAQSGVASNLATVDVVAPEGRAGFLLTQDLDDVLARNRDVPAVYRMNLMVSETRYPRGVRIDNVATRYEYVLSANYVLTDIHSGKVAKRGTVRVELTYNSADQPYAAIAAQQDAEIRAAVEAARRIQLDLAAWLATSEPKVASRS